MTDIRWALNCNAFQVCSGASHGRWWILGPDGFAASDSRGRRRYFATSEDAERARDKIVGYSLGRARYAKGCCAVRAIDGVDGWKGPAAHLLDSLGFRWSNRERAYIGSERLTRKFIILHAAGWTACCIMRRLYPPLFDAATHNGLPANQVRVGADGRVKYRNAA